MKKGRRKKKKEEGGEMKKTLVTLAVTLTLLLGVLGQGWCPPCGIVVNAPLSQKVAPAGASLQIAPEMVPADVKGSR